MKEFLDQNDPYAVLIPFSGLIENKLVAMTSEEKKNFCEVNNTSRQVELFICNVI